MITREGQRAKVAEAVKSVRREQRKKHQIRNMSDSKKMLLL